MESLTRSAQARRWRWGPASGTGGAGSTIGSAGTGAGGASSTGTQPGSTPPTGVAGSAPPPPTTTQPPISSDGWTALVKSADTRVVYVSSSGGDDTRDGSTPDLAVATLARGYAALRTGYPDWLLLKAGDTWDKAFGPKWEKSGRSPTEKMVVSSYGDGPAPLLRTPLDGNMFAAVWLVDSTSHVAIVGINMRPASRVPGEADFDASVSTQGPFRGISIYNGPSDILVEGCHISHYTTNIEVQQAGKQPTDVTIRRNVIVDAWADSATSHSQGIYVEGTVRLLIEENILDHNGWNESITGAEPTIFNHNIYMNAAEQDPIIRGNLSTRASSMCFKIKAEDSAYENSGLLIESNVCIDDAIGVSLGGNPPASGLMYKDVTVRKNVFSHMGPRPNAQATCFGIDISSAEGAEVTNNYLLDTDQAASSYGLTVQNLPNTDVLVSGNVLNHWNATPAFPSSVAAGITLANNWVERPATEFVDGSRSVESYATAQGLSGGVDGLIAQARQQTKARWRVELTGKAIANYIDAGFTRR
jgi:hypothetical protein